MSEIIKILFLRPSLDTGGADRVTLNLLQNFDQERFEVSIGLFNSNGRLEDQIPKAIRVLKLNGNSIFTVIPSLLKLYKEAQYDVLYCTSSGMSVSLLIARFFAGRGTTTTVVSERTALVRKKNGSLKDKILYFIKKKLSHYADFIVVVSTALRKEVLELDTKIAPQKVIKCSSPIIPDSLKSLVNEKIDTNSFNSSAIKILSVGRLVPIKDYFTLLNSFAITLKKIPNAKLFLLGEGPLQEEISSKAKELNISENVCLLGFVENPYKYMSKSDVFILSSLNEGLPGSLVQAMACGVPVISTDCPTGPRELIRDGENGYLVSVGDAATMAIRTIELLQNKVLANTFRREGPLRVSNYVVSKATDEYYRFLKQN